MRINRDFIVREIASENGEKTYYAVAAGNAAKDFHGMLKLNRTAAFIWEGLNEGLSPELVAKKLSVVYDVSEEEAAGDVKKTIEELSSVGAVLPE